MHKVTESDLELGVIRTKAALEVLVAPTKKQTIGTLSTASPIFKERWSGIPSLSPEELNETLKKHGPDDWARKFLNAYFPELDHYYTIRGSEVLIKRMTGLLFIGHTGLPKVQCLGKEINLTQPVHDLALSVNQAVADRHGDAIYLDVVDSEVAARKAADQAKTDPLWVVVFAGAVDSPKSKPHRKKAH